MTRPSKTPFSRTDLTKRDKVHRLIHKIEGRVIFFQEQVDYRSGHPDYADYLENLLEFQAHASQTILKLKGVGNYYNYNETLGDIDKRPTLRERIKRADEARKRYTDAYDWVKQWPDRFDHIEAEIGIIMPEQYWQPKHHEWITNKLSEGSFHTSVQVLKMRLLIEVEQAYQNRRYMMFTTLTVDVEYYDDIFRLESTAWRNYIRRIHRLTYPRSKYDSYRDAKRAGAHWFDYLCVVEEGSDAGRLHLHWIGFFTENPGFIDPNSGLSTPYKREIDEMEYEWPYGHSQSIAVRWSNSDAWGNDGWAWPVQKDGQPIEESNFIKIIQYLLKYILKTKLNRKELPWRTKTSRMLGKSALRAKLSRMKASRIYSLALMTVYPTKIRLHGMKSPTKFIRDESVRELIERYRAKKKRLRALPADTRLRTLLRNSTLRKHNRKSMNSGNILAEILTGKVVSSRYMHDNWKAARQEIEKEFPPVLPYNVSGGITDGR